MVDRIAAAERAVAAASDVTDDRTIREQLQTIHEGLATLDEETASEQQGDRLEQVEAKLVGLGDEADDDAVVERLEEARDHIDAYRRDRTRDW